MMPMASTTGWLGFTALWTLHILSVFAFGIGAILFVIFAAKTFTADKLKTWALALVIGGTVVCLFTIGMRGGQPWGYGMHGGKNMMQNNMMEMMMNRMMEHDKKAGSDDHAEMEGMMRMMMGGMEKSDGAMKMDDGQ